MQISPGWPSATSLPLSSRSATSVDGIGTPMVPLYSSRSSGLIVAARRGLGQAVAFEQRRAGHLLPALGDRLLHRHAAAERRACSCEKSSLAKSGLLRSALNSVFTPGDHVVLVLRRAP